MRDQFTKELHSTSHVRREQRDPILAPLKTAVLDHAFNLHDWDSKATDYLVRFFNF